MSSTLFLKVSSIQPLQRLSCYIVADFQRLCSIHSHFLSTRIGCVLSHPFPQLLIEYHLRPQAMEYAIASKSEAFADKCCKIFCLTFYETSYLRITAIEAQTSYWHFFFIWESQSAASWWCVEFISCFDYSVHMSSSH